MRESDIEKHLVKLAKQKGWFCRKVRWVGHNGAPDRLLISPGGFVTWWVEVKAPGRVPTAQQKAEHNRMRTHGQIVRVVNSIEGVEDLLS